MPSDATTSLSSLPTHDAGRGASATTKLPLLLSILIIAATSAGLWWLIFRLVALV